ncbi:MAG: hypothetical protein KC933_11820 [Myxococcales bacterium]|nr:hypothetical protein [Myxococcales bacterium]MCB9649014.1 endonuclease/exonuclease/phosphatase [Deltaproteobacteria bacterium]
MGAKEFTADDWKKIHAHFDAHAEQYGLPPRVYGSAVLASFNIRKLGKQSARSEACWDFLAKVCRRFDLLAVQEVMEDLGGFWHLKREMGREFALIVSDTTGVFPGEQGLGERLGFVYNWSMVSRRELATDITYDRSKILDTLARQGPEIVVALSGYAAELKAWEAADAAYRRKELTKRPKKPEFKVELPTFLTFIRSPFCVAFEVNGFPSTKPYKFLAINAHLYFGNYVEDRRQEFQALMQWILQRMQGDDGTGYPDLFLLGDLNLDFDNPEQDRQRITDIIEAHRAELPKATDVYFPFLEVRPGCSEVFKTNARMSETFDQIGLFTRDPRFPRAAQHCDMGQGPRGPDYGVFDFPRLFADALGLGPIASMSSKDKAGFYARFEHEVSDHLPLWLRVPLP